MGTTADKLQRLVEGKQAIVDAVNSKANTSLTINSKLSDVASAINGISSGGGSENLLQNKLNTREARGLFAYWTEKNLDEYINSLNFGNVTGMSYMFYSCSYITSIPQFNTSNARNMYNMFYSCSKLTTIPQLDTSNVVDTCSMFAGCSVLTTIPQLDTSKVTDISSMFNNCKALTSVPQLDTSSVTRISSMFYRCSLLETIDITYYNISSTSNSSNFVRDCTALKALIIREFGANYVLNSSSFTGSGIANGTGYVYVPRSMVSTLQSATNWSTYASQIRALEDYTVDGTTTGALDETKI